MNRLLRIGCSVAMALGLSPDVMASDDHARAFVIAPITIPDHEARVWEVTAQGEIEPLEFLSEELGGSVLHGRRGSVVSPNRQWIAYVRDNDLWLYDVANHRQLRLTNVGRPRERNLKEVYVSIRSWSPDSERLIYHVGFPDVLGCEPPREPMETRPAPYGFHEYDLSRDEHRLLDDSAGVEDFLAAHHLVWLPDGSYLVSASSPGGSGASLLKSGPINLPLLPGPDRPYVVRVNSDGSARDWSFPFQILGGTQSDVSTDGRWLAVLASIPQEGRKVSENQLWKIDLVTGDAAPVTPVDVWCRNYQIPRFSPSGRHLAYVGQERCADPDRPRHLLFVDSRRIHEQMDGFHFVWISDDAIAVTDPNSILVLDPDSGAVIGVRSIR